MTYASDLASLVDAYAEADADEKAAADRKKDLRDQLLLIYSEQADEMGPPVLNGAKHIVRVTSTESWRIDTTKLKAEHPVLYAAYAKKSASMRLTVSPR